MPEPTARTGVRFMGELGAGFPAEGKPAPPIQSSSATGLPGLPPLSVPDVAPPARPEAPSPAGTGSFSVAAPRPTKRSTGRFASLVVLLVVVVGAIAGGAVVLSNSSSKPAGIQSPTRANAALYAAAMESGSFHYSGTSTGTEGGSLATGTVSGDAGETEGVQTLKSSIANYEVIVLNSVAYMKPDLNALENTFGYTASEAAPYANRWIEITPSEAPYQAVAADVTTGSVWGRSSQSPTDGLSHAPVTVSPVFTSKGQSVQSVAYSMHGAAQGSGVGSYSGTEHITFDAAGPHVPSSLTEHLTGTANGMPSTSNSSFTFSNWGRAVNVKAPAGAIPFSSLPPPPTTA